MKLIVIDPKTGAELTFEANPAEMNTQHGWSVTMPNNQSIFITLYEGKWESRNNKIASPELVNAIGKAINQNSVPEKVDPGNTDLHHESHQIEEPHEEELIKKIDEEEYQKKFN